MTVPDRRRYRNATQRKEYTNVNAYNTKSFPYENYGPWHTKSKPPANSEFNPEFWRQRIIVKCS